MCESFSNRDCFQEFYCVTADVLRFVLCFAKCYCPLSLFRELRYVVCTTEDLGFESQRGLMHIYLNPLAPEFFLILIFAHSVFKM
jgi:hypothetical protein